MSARFLITPSVRSDVPAGMFSEEEYQAVEAAYHSEPPTPLHHGGQLLIKDESNRMCLNAFKILGVRYAIQRLRAEDRLPAGTVLACATDGNHGRAVARTASRMGLESHIFLPSHASQARIDAIAGEGGEVHVCSGNYDDAVREAAREAEAHENWLVVSDTSWPGYEEIPRWIMCGYTHMLTESARQWPATPDIVFVQAGVGGLACAAGSWFAHHYGKWRPYLILCQPARSAPVIEAAVHQRPVRLSGSQETIMDCLSAGEVSHTAWPVISSTFDAYIKVEENSAVEAVGALQEKGVEAGFSGACGMAAYLQFARRPEFAVLREAASFSDESSVMIIVTEGAQR
jgi:diaminopropionate ammonia-lyase